MSARRAVTPPFEIGGVVVEPGTRARFNLPAALLPTRTPVDIPISVVHGRRPGPRLWVSATIHGDELNGIEVIRQVLDRVPDPLPAGTLVAVPIVNVIGFINQSRYLPDRRDLNRSFPGSRRGSLASRIAHLFMTEVVERCTHGIDLHTASLEKSNYPQTRVAPDDPGARALAEAFCAPVTVASPPRKGSLRASASERGVPVLLYEAGEAQRFDTEAVRYGVEGVLSVMAELGMVSRRHRIRRRRSIEVVDSDWIRARRGGLLRLTVRQGEFVSQGEPIGRISDPFGEDETLLKAPFDGVVIGATGNPVVHGGDAVVHLGRAEAGFSIPIGPPGTH